MDFKVAQQEDEIELVCSEPADLIPGYTLMEKMGDGSLTTVYKVCKQGINEIFAAKVLRSQFSTSPRTVKRFVQEAKKATVLNNPHVVSVYEVGKTTTGQPFVICDFVDGGTLAERLAAEGRLDDLTTVDMLLQICEGLKSAHNNDFIHRDTNPGNIVFKNTAEGQLAKLADFGIAKALPGPGRETKYTTPEDQVNSNTC